MGLARLIARAWVAVCLYAGAMALRFEASASADSVSTLISVVGCTALFLAMGLVFTGGGIFLSGHAGILKRRWRRTHPWRFGCGFDEAVFIAFAVVSFLDLAFFAPEHLSAPMTVAVERAAYFAVPGQRAFVSLARPCLFDGGRILTSAVSWCLAIVYLGSALSRLKRRAGERRLLAAVRPDLVGGRGEAILLAAVSVVGIQLLYVGSAYGWLACSFYTGVAGALLVGLAPLMLAYAIVEALTLLSIGAER